MSYIIGKACIDCVDGSCRTVCPMDCIHGPIHSDGMGKELDYLKDTDELKKLNNPQLYINPIECIDCGACVPECPVDAIYSSENEAIQMGDEISVKKNYDFFGLDYKIYPI